MKFNALWRGLPTCDIEANKTIHKLTSFCSFEEKQVSVRRLNVSDEKLRSECIRFS